MTLAEPQSVTTRTLRVPCATQLWYDEPAPGAVGRFAIVVFCGRESDVVPLTPNRPLVVGRRAPSEILLDDPAVSRQHARFSIRNGNIFVEDLDSSNGTLFRGRRIKRERLEPGDEVRVGPAAMVVAATRPGPAPKIDDELVIINPAMRELYRIAERSAAATVPVLILGETGTGKEHLARAFHANGPRRDRAFVAVNCGAIPASLTESVLFGHERGAFTGAATRSAGVFEQASGGVLFLDEIGEMSPSAQTGLLRVLETQRVRRLGGSQDIAVDVRVVAATHCDLDRMMRDGSFREDLYYRLSTLVLEVPPLRERRDEIQPLAQRFLREAQVEWGTGPVAFGREALDALQSYEWPGNIRQLRHVVQRAVLLGQTDCIELPVAGTLTPAPGDSAAPPLPEAGLRDALEDYEVNLLKQALQEAGGNREAAAKLLRLPLRTLFRKLRQYGISEGPGALTE